MPFLSHRKISVRSDKHIVHSSRNDKWARYYGDRRWKRLRNWKITNSPLCEDCLFNGRSVAATQVHHVKPFGEGLTEEERIELLLSPENIISLCDDCHRKRHKILRSQKKKNKN